MRRRHFVAAACAAALSAPLARAQKSEPYRLVILGDSLTAGLGVSKAESFPAQLVALLRAKGYDVRVIAAGVSGDTIADGLARLDWSVPDRTDGVLIALGGNDMLKGVDPALSRRALEDMLRRLRERGKDTALAGMRATANLGARYATTFERMYRDLSGAYDAPLYPFLLEGVALNPKLNQTDGFHPNAAGAKRIAEKLAPFVESAFALPRSPAPARPRT